MNSKFFSLRCFVILLLCVGGTTLWAQDRASFNIVPQPLSMQTATDAAFELTPQSVIVVAKNSEQKSQVAKQAAFLQQYIAERTGWKLKIVKDKQQAHAIRVGIAKSATLDKASQIAQRKVSAEAYRLESHANGLGIVGSDAAGLFYGMQTLRKSLPHLSEGDRAATERIEIPAASIVDAPRFSYRGAMLDVARHYITPDSLRRFVDMLAMHNINRFHLHITDDQGWRMEIKRYPKLTSIGSVRKQTVLGKNTGVYNGKPYGGFYTQRELRDLVAYAAARHIVVVPEIDLPGHMQAALAAYPQLGCTGGPYEVAQFWGVMDDVLCAGRDSTYQFIANVLKEVAQVFPSEYIHVGGDECPKTRWQACPRCQAFIEKHGLQADGKHSAEERLQSYVIRFASEQLAKLGRKIIGWDEILEGGLAPGATVMAWRGENYGRETARMGHDAIMSPTSHLYLDYYQSKNIENEPFGIGGYLPLSTVYAFEPVPDSFTPEEAAHIVGVQGNLWTEYVSTFRHAEYMFLPRLAAVAETQWSPRGTKNYDGFVNRLPQLFGLYDEQNYNYARHIFDITAKYGIRPADCVLAELKTFDDAPIYYTLDGTTPTVRSQRYTAPIEIRKDAQLRAVAIRVGERENLRSSARRLLRSHIEQENFTFSLSTAQPISLLQGVSEQYKFAGAQTLADGLRATDTNYRSGRWLGFYGQDLDALIDLGAAREVSQLSFATCVEKGAWIFNARSVEILLSDDGKTFRSVFNTELAPQSETDPNGIYAHGYNFAKQKARFVRLKVSPENEIPAWHSGHGSKAFLFVDEIMVH